ncbi:protein of unknown function [Magnetospirillum sp. XM-1]|nr:protein of unknown function [Magnetospirillum sp. XM-1]
MHNGIRNGNFFRLFILNSVESKIRKRPLINDVISQQ